MKQAVKERIFTVLRNGGILLFLLLGYAIFSLLTGLMLPCPIYSIFHVYCGGCGVSRMCLSILRGDFLSAFHYNMAVFLMLPFFFYMLIDGIYRYIKTGLFSIPKYQEYFLYLCIVILTLFSILRNIPQFSFLAP